MVTMLAYLAVGSLLGVLGTLLAQNHFESQLGEIACPGCDFVVSHDSASEDDARQLMREHDCWDTGEAL